MFNESEFTCHDRGGRTYGARRWPSTSRGAACRSGSWRRRRPCRTVRGARGCSRVPRRFLKTLGCSTGSGRSAAITRELLIHLPDSGTMTMRMDELHAPAPSVPYPNILMIPQWRTCELLAERLAELGGRVEFGVEVTGFTQDDKGVARHAEHRRAGHRPLPGRRGRRPQHRPAAARGGLRGGDPRDRAHADRRRPADRTGPRPLARLAGRRAELPAPRALPAAGHRGLPADRAGRGGRLAGGAAEAHRRGAAGDHAHRSRMDLALPRQHPDGGPLPGRQRVPGRRRRARALAGRRAGAEHRDPGRLQPRLETGRRR